MLDQCFVLYCSFEATMSILRFKIVEIEFDVALRTQKNGLAAILSHRYVVVFEIESQI